MYYRYTEEKLYNPEIGVYTAFGIEAKLSEKGVMVKRVSDLFTDKSKAADFAALLNECGAELVHFEELCQSAIE